MKMILDNAVGYYAYLKLGFMKDTGCILHPLYRGQLGT